MSVRHPTRLAIPAQRRPHVSERGHVQRRPDRLGHLEVLAQLRQELEVVEGRLHVQAVASRTAGATWAEIGRALGMTAKSGAK